MTGDEAVGVLDEQLDASLAVFDGMILDERATVQDIENQTPYDESGSGTGGEFDGPLFEEGDLSAAGTGGYGTDSDPAATASVEGNTTTTASSSTPAMQTASSDGSIPEDIPDGSDDDIVARQIREAAMKEQDPVLREKLWEEYRKYKNQR